MSWDNVKPPVPTDGWGTPPKWPKNKPAMSIVCDENGQPLDKDFIDAGWGEIQRALEEDGEKLRQLTGEDHGPWSTHLATEDGEGRGGSWADLQNDNPVPVNAQIGATQDWLSNTQPNLNEQLNDALWTANALDSAVTKAGVVNALAGTKDEFNIDQDGELTRMKEIVSSTQPGPYGYYIAYHNGRWLHAILSGPYDTQADAYLRADIAYDKMFNDAAFKLAFENKFERAGIYCAQIPLSANRRGAYGVIDG